MTEYSSPPRPNVTVSAMYAAPALMQLIIVGSIRHSYHTPAMTIEKKAKLAIAAEWIFFRNRHEALLKLGLLYSSGIHFLTNHSNPFLGQNSNNIEAISNFIVHPMWTIIRERSVEDCLKRLLSNKCQVAAAVGNPPVIVTFRYQTNLLRIL